MVTSNLWNREPRKEHYDIVIHVDEYSYKKTKIPCGLSWTLIAFARKIILLLATRTIDFGRRKED